MSATRPRSGKYGSHRGTWYPLDHSAKIWPAVLSQRYTSLFRLSVVLKHRVEYEPLRTALMHTMQRYPYFSVQLHRGLFWYYLEEQPVDPREIHPDFQWPCMDFRAIKTHRVLLKIYVYQRRISLEMSHALSDGGGAMEFLKYLIREYLHARTPGLPGEPDHSAPEPGEWVDSYLEHGMKSVPNSPLPARAFHVPFALLPRGEYRVVSGYVSLESVRSRSSQLGVSVTEYLTSLLFYALQDYWFALQDANHRIPARYSRPLRILVPVNLRPIFNSRTMRNFFVYVDPEIDPRLGRYSFEELVRFVHHYMRGQKHRQNLRRQFARHARTERKISVRLIPLLLKNIVLSLSYRRLGDSRFTTSLSNMGSFSLSPEEMKEIDWVDFFPPPSPVMKQAVSVISCGDTLSISFGKMISETVIERRFFRLMRLEGHDVRIFSNYSRSGP